MVRRLDDRGPRRAVVVHRSSHHAGVSGNDALARHLDAHRVVGERGQRFPYRLRRLWAQRARTPLPYDSQSVAKELEVLAWLGRGPGLVHVLDGERDFRLLGARALDRRLRRVLTVHLPPAALARALGDGRRWAAVDAVVALAGNQADLLAEALPATRVARIPHGVDIDYFRPEPVARAGPLRLLSVGQHLRDFDLLAAVHAELQAQGADVELEVVVPADLAPTLAPRLPGAAVRSDLTDDELRAAYRQADLGLLTFLDAAACNALLEGQACGLPTVVNAAGGPPEYVPAELRPAVDDTAAALAARALELAAAARDGDALRARVRAHAEQFAWPRIAAAVTELYDEVEAAPPDRR